MKSLVLILALAVSVPAMANPPKLFFESGFAFDNMCGRGLDYSKLSTPSDPKRYTQEWGQELESRLQEFQAAWDSVGPKLLHELNARFRKVFARKEFTVTLSACAVSPSMPNPLLLNVTRHLHSYMRPRSPRSLESFPDLPFHELLHIWLDENFSGPLPLKTKYKMEAPGVISHLYLFAIQSAVYEALGMTNQWSEIRGRHISFGGPHKRAMELLDSEGRERILKDLK